VVQACSHNSPTVPRPTGAVARADDAITQKRLLSSFGPRHTLTGLSPRLTAEDQEGLDDGALFDEIKIRR
jgi:hypothetical protein